MLYIYLFFFIVVLFRILPLGPVLLTHVPLVRTPCPPLLAKTIMGFAVLVTELEPTGIKDS